MERFLVFGLLACSAVTVILCTGHSLIASLGWQL
jgi:hypothetical protein